MENNSICCFSEVEAPKHYIDELFLLSVDTSGNTYLKIENRIEHRRVLRLNGYRIDGAGLNSILPLLLNSSVRRLTIEDGMRCLKEDNFFPFKFKCIDVPDGLLGITVQPISYHDRQCGGLKVIKSSMGNFTENDVILSVNGLSFINLPETTAIDIVTMSKNRRIFVACNFDVARLLYGDNDSLGMLWATIRARYLYLMSKSSMILPSYSLPKSILATKVKFSSNVYNKLKLKYSKP